MELSNETVKVNVMTYPLIPLKKGIIAEAKLH